MLRMAGNDLGIRIRRARERKGWSQHELAERLTEQRGGRPVGVRSVGRWERGEAVPRNAIGALEALLGNLTSDEHADMYTDPDEARIWGWVEYQPHERRAMISALREARGGRAG